MITPLKLKKLLNSSQEIALIDLREEGDFGKEHILLATSLPISQLELRIDSLVPNKQTKIILMDTCNEIIPQLAKKSLNKWNYNNIDILKGGLENWKKTGHEIYSGVNVPSKAFGEYVENTYKTPSLKPEELKKLIEDKQDILIFDARPNDEYQRMSIPGAIDAPGVEIVNRACNLITNPDTQIIVNCAGRTRSIIGAQSLINIGLPNPIYALENGTMGWHLSGYQLERGAAKYARCPSINEKKGLRRLVEKVVKKYNVKFLDYDVFLEMKKTNKKSNLYFLDVRSPKEYSQTHIRGSRNAPGGQLVQATDKYIGVRNSKIILVDDTETRSIMTASWLIQMGRTEVYVLKNGMIGNPDLTSSSFKPKIYGDPSSNSIPPRQLKSLLERDQCFLIDISTSLKYREGHIPGSCWSLRSALKKEISKINKYNKVVITSDDGTLASLAVKDLENYFTEKDIFFLKGGTKHWEQNKYLTETKNSNFLCDTKDVQYKPYDHSEEAEKFMIEYLEWEINLLDQININNSLTFHTFN